MDAQKNYETVKAALESARCTYMCLRPEVQKYWDGYILGITPTLATPCPCEALRAENAELQKIRDELNSFAAQMHTERDEAIRLRTLVQEQSTKDLEAKRAAALEEEAVNPIIAKLRTELEAANRELKNVATVIGFVSRRMKKL